MSLRARIGAVAGLAVAGVVIAIAGASYVADRAELRGYVPLHGGLMEVYRRSHALLHVSTCTSRSAGRTFTAAWVIPRRLAMSSRSE